MKKLPHICFYTGDWMKDPRLSLCKPATRGVWIDLLCAMHECDRSGELRGTNDQLARLARCSTVELEEALTELQTTGAADLLQRNGTWVIANRRMKKEAVIREKRAIAGSKGGSTSGANREQKPETDNDIDCERVVVGYCKEIGLPDSDGQAVFSKWQGNGWTNRGEPIRDWKATIRSWKLQGFMPSQKPKTSDLPPWKSAAERRQSEIDAANRAYRAKKAGLQEEGEKSDPKEVARLLEEFKSKVRPQENS